MYLPTLLSVHMSWIAAGRVRGVSYFLATSMHMAIGADDFGLDVFADE